MKKVSAPEVVTTLETSESPLPAQIQEALGELVGAARQGLLALSVGVGLGIVHELMELEVDEVVGPRGKHNPDRAARRHGHEDGLMTLGGRRVPVRRPRMRTADDEPSPALRCGRCGRGRRGTGGGSAIICSKSNAWYLSPFTPSGLAVLTRLSGLCLTQRHRSRS